MTDREKVIKGLECCQKKVCIYDDTLKECPYWELCGRHEDAFEDCTKVLAKDALALLKAREARVMTLDEALGAEVNVDQCWLEVNDIRQIYLADAVVCPEHLERADIQRWGATDCQLPLDLYGKYWRMWTAKPTDEQREAIPWMT